MYMYTCIKSYIQFDLQSIHNLETNKRSSVFCMIVVEIRASSSQVDAQHGL